MSFNQTNSGRKIVYRTNGIILIIIIVTMIKILIAIEENRSDIRNCLLCYT